MIQTLQTSEEQANLHIAQNMDVNNLPQLMQSVLSLANTPAEKDMLLMSALTACSSVLPNLYFKYGIGAKRYYPNLQLFIVGSAASEKVSPTLPSSSSNPLARNVFASLATSCGQFSVTNSKKGASALFLCSLDSRKLQNKTI